MPAGVAVVPEVVGGVIVEEEVGSVRLEDGGGVLGTGFDYAALTIS